jgi:hypothetical protein
VKPLWVLTVITVNAGAAATDSVIRTASFAVDSFCTAGLRAGV